MHKPLVTLTFSVSVLLVSGFFVANVPAYAEGATAKGQGQSRVERVDMASADKLQAEADEAYRLCKYSGVFNPVKVIQNCRQAAAIYDAALAADPANKDAIFGGARARQVMIDVSDKQWLQKVPSIYWKAVNKRIEDYQVDRQKLYNEALKSYSQLLTVDPTNYNALVCRADLVVDTNPKQAIADCTKAVSVDAKDYQVFGLRGKAEAKLNQTQPAIEDLTVAIRTGDRDIDEWLEYVNLRAQLYEKKGEHLLAQRDKETAAKFVRKAYR